LFWKRLLLLLGREGRGDEAMAFLRNLKEDGHT
jgi:pentatricopeptide repeat protein